jgi:hypothetical protein
MLLCAAMIAGNARGEQLAELPQDAYKPYLTVVGTAGEAKFESLKIAFEKHEGLREFADTTHFAVLADSTTMYRARYSTEFGRLPVVRLQEADGDVVYEVSGRDIPPVDVLVAELSDKCSSSTCIRRKPAPERPDGIDVGPSDKRDTDQPKPAKGRVKWQLVFLCIGVSVAGFCGGVMKVVLAEWAAK